MADRFLARVMGELVAVEAPALPDGAAKYIASRVVDREADGSEAHVVRIDPLPHETVSGSLRRLSRAFAATLAPEFPGLLWLPFSATLVQESGVVIVCDEDETAADPHDVIGIDVEGGFDPLLCAAAELVPSADGARTVPTEPLRLWSRVARVVIARRVGPGEQTVVEALPHHDAAERLLARRRTPRGAGYSVHAVADLLKATAGAVGVRYADRLEVRDALNAIDSRPTRDAVPSSADPRAASPAGSAPTAPARTDEPRWHTTDGAVWTSSPDRAALLDTADVSAEPVVLEESAQVIWECLIAEPGATSTQIVHRVAEVYDVDAEQIRASVVALLAELRERGLAVVR